MNYKNIANVFDLASKVGVVALAPAIIISTAATVILFHLTVLFSLLSGNLREKFSLMVRNPVVLSFLLFFLLFLLGATYSTAPTSEVLITLRKYSKFLLAIMLFPVFAEEKWRNLAIFSFMIGILIMLIFSYLHAYGYFHWWATGLVEVFKNRIEFNFLLAFAAYLCLIKIASSRCYRFIWLIFLVLIVHTVLFRSMGRSGYFVFAGLITLFFLQKLQWKGLVIAITSVLLLFSSAFIFSPTFKGRLQAAYSDIKTYNKSDETSVGLRITFLRNGLKLIKANPFFGTGTGSYATEYSAIKPTPPDLKIIQPPNPHNGYIYIAVQFGIVGLIILLLFFASHLWYSKFLPEKEKYIARGIVIAMMIGSLSNTCISDITVRYLYVYFIALSFAVFGGQVLTKDDKSCQIVVRT